MTDRLDNMEPGPLWGFFLELSKIPRGSGHEAAAAAWVAEQARRMGCEVSQDAAGNVLARQPATPGREGAPVVALQAHVDMVCEKDPHVTHDFLRDPIPVVREGGRIKAAGTTLGADDGIGVAAALAVLASRDIPHGPLEVLITIDEERGLAGAKHVPAGLLKAEHLLNLDSGQEGCLIIGCAGGLYSDATRKVALRPAGEGNVPFWLRVTGLKGGHSGGDIDRGRGNAIQLLARALHRLGSLGVELAALEGGDKRNAIPREACARLFVAPGQEAAVRTEVEELEADLRAAFGTFEPAVALKLERDDAAPREVMETQEAARVVAFLLSLPHGVVEHSPVMPGQIQTSTNLAAVSTRDGLVEVQMSHRSSLESSKRALAERIRAVCGLAGFEWIAGGAYPGWIPEPGAPLVQLVCRTYEALSGASMRIEATHGGLECGLFGQGHPGLQMVSFGPDIKDNHSPSESMGIDSVARFWRLLAAVLEGLA